MKLLLLPLFKLLLPLSIPLPVFSTMSYASMSESEEGLWKIEGVLSALNDSHDEVKIRALEKMVEDDALFRTHFKKIESGIGKLLESRSADVRRNAVLALKAMGESAKGYAPQIAALLKDSDYGVREAAVRVLRAMGESKKEYIPQIIALLKGTNDDVREAAVEVLGAMGESKKEYIPQIIALLKGTNDDVRKAAVEVLGAMGESAKGYAPQIAALLKDPDYGVRRAAVKLIGAMGESAKGYAPQIAALLKDPDYGVRAAAVKVLGAMGESAKGYAPQIAALLKDSDDDVRRAAVEVLGAMGESAKGYAPQIAALLKDTDNGVRKAAVKLIGAMGESAKEYAPQIAALLKDTDNDVQKAAVEVLGRISPVDINTILVIVNQIYESISLLGSHIFFAYYFCGGEPDLTTFIKWIGSPEYSQKDIEYDEGRRILGSFTKVWEPSKDFPRIQERLEKQTAMIIDTLKRKWNYKDVSLLEQHAFNLKGSTHGDSVRNVISTMKRREKIIDIAKKSGVIGLGHGLFWLTLIFGFSRSPTIQAVFFWNPWVRWIAGFGYVSLALTWVPFFRRKLLAPFKNALLSDAHLESFDSQSYFAESEVKELKTGETKPIKEAITQIRGQIVLEGESGLGKTMFLRFLMKSSKRIVAYLLADRCSCGIVEAIQNKLLGPAKDPSFLESLIYDFVD